MKTLANLTILFYLVLIPPQRTDCQESLTLVSSGTSNYTIVLPRFATRWENMAARELQSALRTMTGVELPILFDTTAPRTEEIVLGRENRRATGLDQDSLGDNGFIIRTVGDRLFIVGGAEKGTLYGVYSFLEDELGCRKYSARVTVIPRKVDVRIPGIRVRQIPPFTYRRIHAHDAFDQGYALWHKLDSDSEGVTQWGLFVHTFQTLVPPQQYFKTHPEYFSMMNGIRVSDGQLCLTNPEVYRVLAENLRRRILDNPAARIWSVSQNDNFSNCRCPDCSAFDEREGSPAGTLLAFVNRVAEDFPDKIISTLAYQYTRRPPKTMRPRVNVNIVLCSIECNRSKPLATDSSSTSFVRDLRDWSRLTHNLMIWDYTVQFRNLVSPFPNLRVLQPNLRLFLENGAGMMFQQANGAFGGEWAELRTYLIAKLLWNPDVDLGAVMEDFLRGYYGAAALPLGNYIRTMHDALEVSGQDLLIYGNPIMPMTGYLAPALMASYTTMFDSAERTVASEPVLLQRVKDARLPLTYAILEQSKVAGRAEGGGAFRYTAEGTWEVRPEIRILLKDFVTACERRGPVLIEEMGTTPAQYRASMENMWARSMEPNTALGASVLFLTPYSKKYPAMGDLTLTDGLRGVEDYHYNWLGWEGVDGRFTVDLGRLCPIETVRCDFLQDINSWVFLPHSVLVEISRDGQAYITVAEIPNRIPESAPGSFRETFQAFFPRTETRYIRVSTSSMKTCPRWHKGYGGLAWIFTDEVIAK